MVVLSVDPKGNGGDFEKGSCSQEEEVWRRTTYSAVAGATQFLPLSGSAVRYNAKEDGFVLLVLFMVLSFALF